MNDINENNNTPWMTVVFSNNYSSKEKIELITKFLKNGMKLTIPIEKKYYTLNYILNNNSFSLIQFLLENEIYFIGGQYNNKEKFYLAILLIMEKKIY